MSKEATTSMAGPPGKSRRSEPVGRSKHVSAPFNTRSETVRRLLYLLDLSLTVLVFLWAVRVYDIFRGVDPERTPDYYGVLLISVLAFLISRRVVGKALDVYLQPFPRQVMAIVQTMVMTFGLTTVVLFVFDIEFVSRLILGGFALGNTIALAGFRGVLSWWYFSRHRDAAENRIQVLIVGSGRRAQRLAALLRGSDVWRFDVVGFVDPHDPERFNRRSTDNVIGHVDEISKVLAENVVDEVVVAVPRTMLGDLQGIIDACQLEGVQLRFMADFYDFRAARVELSMVGEVPLLSFEPVARDERMLLVKRFLDLTLTLLALPVLIPLFLLVALAIRIDSKGPAIFVQQRVGLHKRKFRMYKFRSMVQDAEARMKEIEHLNEASGPNFKVANDPRMTRVGRFIRKTSIDELPQLINVLKGDMSLVGPRPMSIRDVNLFNSGEQRKRFSVRPGITCLWQISGRSDLTFDEWLKLDLEYIDNWSLGMDLKILLKTVPTVLRGSGAV